MANKVIYLIHFDRPLAHAKHYMGSTKNLEERLACHRGGGADSARLMQVIRELKIPWRLARTWPGGRKAERRLKNLKNAPRLCPICNPNPGPTERRRRER